MRVIFLGGAMYGDQSEGYMKENEMRPETTQKILSGDCVVRWIFYSGLYGIWVSHTCGNWWIGG